MEIGAGDHDDTDDYKDKKLALQEHHVVRGHDLLHVVHGIRALWNDAKLSQAGLDTANRDFFGVVDFGSIACSQFLPYSTQDLPTQVPANHVENAAAERGAGSEGPPAKKQRADSGPSQTPMHQKYLMLTDPEVPNSQIGYGPEGASVQRSDQGPTRKDYA